MSWNKEQMAERAAKEILPGTIVNLGIGLPTLVADYLPADLGVWFQSENGLLGMGPFPFDGEEDSQLINAGKQTVTIVPGGSIFDSALSFGMIRGGHVDLAILGAMQIAENGDLANWAIPGGKVMGIGGAMDLASGARRILVMTTHTTKEGEPKLVPKCSYPLTAKACVHRILSELAVVDVTPSGFRLVELAPGVTEDEVRAKTGAPLLVSAS
jgi:3-oxoacid CoA-transferase subunit B